MKKQLFLFLFLASSCTVSLSQDLNVGDLANIDPEAVLMDSLNSIKSSFGVTKIGGDYYAGVRVQPEFRVGKFGFGFDIPVQINLNTKKLRTEEFKGGIEILRLIRYFTYGRKKSDPIYVRIGDLTGVSLGYGMLINNYSNSPGFEMRKVGVNLDLNFKGIFGAEVVYGDIKGANLIGVRPYVRPLRTTSIPIIKTFEIGASYVFDKGSNVDSASVYLQQDGMKAMAFDAGITFLNIGIIKIMGYGQTSQLNRIKSNALDLTLTTAGRPVTSYIKGKGSSAGIATKLKVAGTVFMVDARIERLWYKDDYLPQFFDAIYEINKDAKILSLTNAKAQQGIYGSLGMTLFNKFRINGALMMPDVVSAETPALVQVGLEAFKLADKLTISGHYIKGGLKDLKDAFTLDQNSLANATLSYQLAKFFYIGADYRWTFARLEDGTIKATNYFRPFFGLSIPLGGGGKE
jgi:hypothetical protein